MGDEGDLLAARWCDMTAGEEAAGISEEDHLQQHHGWVGGGAGVIVAKATIEMREVDFVVEEMIQGMLKGAGNSCRSRSSARKRGEVSIGL